MLRVMLPTGVNLIRQADVVCWLCSFQILSATFWCIGLSLVGWEPVDVAWAIGSALLHLLVWSEAAGVVVFWGRRGSIQKDGLTSCASSTSQYPGVYPLPPLLPPPTHPFTLTKSIFSTISTPQWSIVLFCSCDSDLFFQPSCDGLPLPSDRRLCPICQHTRRVPTTLATSGYELLE